MSSGEHVFVFEADGEQFQETASTDPVECVRRTLAMLEADDGAGLMPDLLIDWRFARVRLGGPPALPIGGAEARVTPVEEWERAWVWTVDGEQLMDTASRSPLTCLDKVQMRALLAESDEAEAALLDGGSLEQVAVPPGALPGRDEEKDWDRVERVMAAVRAELWRATNEYGAFASAHEGWAVIREEVDELWELIRARAGSDRRAAEEAVQVAAAAARYAVDVAPLAAADHDDAVQVEEDGE